MARVYLRTLFEMEVIHPPVTEVVRVLKQRPRSGRRSGTAPRRRSTELVLCRGNRLHLFLGHIRHLYLLHGPQLTAGT